MCYANETSVFIQPSVYADQLAALLDQMYEAYENQTEEASIIPEEGMHYLTYQKKKKCSVASLCYPE